MRKCLVLCSVLSLAVALPLWGARDGDKPAPLDCTGKDGVSAADVQKA